MPAYTLHLGQTRIAGAGLGKLAKVLQNFGVIAVMNTAALRPAEGNLVATELDAAVANIMSPAALCWALGKLAAAGLLAWPATTVGNAALC